MKQSEATRGLSERAAECDWYHTIELPGGIITDGWFDLRPVTATVPLPESLRGRRCLDVGTWDGFWAFEMERRGGSVTAIDVEDPDRWDWPARGRAQAVLAAFKAEGRAFRLAAEALESHVERIDASIYELEPDRFGHFDLVFVGSLLLHLRDPVGALSRVRSVCAGELVLADAVDLYGSLTRRGRPRARLEGYRRPWWWIPNVAALRRMAEAAGFEVVASSGLFAVPCGAGHPSVSFPRNPFSAEGLEQLALKLRGVPHAAFRLRPA